MNVSRFKSSVLVVDDDPSVLALLAVQLAADFEVVTAATAEQARAVLAGRNIDIVLSDLHLPDESGLVLLESVRRASPRTARVLITGAGRIEDAVDAINHAQIHRIVLKPWRAEDLRQTLTTIGRVIVMERSHERLLEELNQKNADLEARVVARTREIEEKTHILEQMALTDTLTGKPNRRSVEHVARREVLRRVRVPGPLAIGMIDVDYFKQINTQHLLTGGDHVLIWLARTVGEAIRVTDSFGRWGGEEFMVVAPDTDAAGASVLAERLRAHVEASSVPYNGAEIKVTVSIGFAVAEAGVDADCDQMLEESASALQEAKDGGRNRWVVRSLESESVPA
jgi:diguanylate cyclase (GGDEF)-like protein